MDRLTRVDVAVIGAGPSGLVVAVACAKAGLKTALIGPPATADNRTSALWTGPVEILARLGVWERCAAAAMPLSGIRIVDVTRRLIRAPEVLCEAHEIGQDCFGYNVRNADLIAALEAVLAETGTVVLRDTVAALDPQADEVRLTCASGETVAARLVVAADGPQSIGRQAAGIAFSLSPYPQAALTFNTSHRRDHHDISTEFHTEQGPLAFVPLGPKQSSVVWVMSPAEAARRMELPDAELGAEAEAVSGSFLGAIAVDPGRFRFDLARATCDRLGARRIALAGHAAHIVPPIGAQGLNLGISDAEAIAEVARRAVEAGGDPGSEAVLADYSARRLGDIRLRSGVIDIVNRSLLSGFLPIQTARSLMLRFAAGFRPLREAVMRRGVGSNALDRPRRVTK